MKTKFIKLLLFLFVNLTVNSVSNGQTPQWDWCKSVTGTIGGATAMGIDIDAHGNTYTTGHYKGTYDFDPGPAVFNLTSTGDYDAFILKLDNNGNFVWAMNLGSNLYDQGKLVTVNKTTNNDIYITGVFTSTVDFDPDTNQVFNFSTYNNMFPDIFILCIDSTGKFKNAQQLRGQYTENPNVARLDVHGNFYMVGGYDGNLAYPTSSGFVSLGSAGSDDIFLIKTDSILNFKWAKRIGGPSIEWESGLAIDLNDDIIICGSFTDSADFDPDPTNSYWISAPTSGTDMFITKLDSGGNFMWAKSFTTGGFGNSSTAVTTDMDGNIYTTGSLRDTVDFDPSPLNSYYLSSSGSYDVFISKLDLNGNFVWAKQFFGTNVQRGYSILAGNDSAVYVSGYYNGLTGFNTDSSFIDTLYAQNTFLFISKLDNQGNLVWVKSNSGMGGTLAYDMAMDNNNVYVCGNIGGNLIFDNDTISTTNGGALIAKLGGFSTGLKSINYLNTLSIYPNPAGDHFTIKFNHPEKEVKLILNDITGKNIYQSKNFNSQSTTINTSNFANGIYLLTVQTEKTTATQKIIVAK